MKSTPFVRTAIAAFTLALGACASTPTTPESLTQAREAFQGARADPHVTRFAPIELNSAGVALDRVEQLWTGGNDAQNIDHLAYLARQQALIAAETAAARAARAEIEQADLERKSVIAQSRTQQARAEQKDAELARKNAELGQATALVQAEAARRQVLVERKRAEELQAMSAQESQQLQQALVERQRAEALQAKAAQDVQQLEKQLRDLKAEQTNRGWILTFGADVLFNVGEAALKPAAYRSLDRLMTFLKAHPEQTIVVEGHTDSTGSEDMNLDLSRRRAEAVQQALAARNIDANRIRTRALGEAFPVASNDTAAGRQLNRRVELVFPNAQQVSLGR